MTSDEWRVAQYINQAFSPKTLLAKIYGLNVEVGRAFCCPFHNDQRKSAKLFGDAVHCFKERRQYRAYDILMLNGFSFDELSKEVPKDFKFTAPIKRNLKDTWYKKTQEVARQWFINEHDFDKLTDSWEIADDIYGGKYE